MKVRGDGGYILKNNIVKKYKMKFYIIDLKKVYKK
jgi:hypothetical protein